MSSSIPMFLVMLLDHVEKRWNSRSQMFSKTDVLNNFAIVTGKNLCWSLFLIKFQDWKPTFLFKKRLQRRCFSINIAKFLITGLRRVTLFKRRLCPQVFSCKFCEILRVLFNRTPAVAAAVFRLKSLGFINWFAISCFGS